MTGPEEAAGLGVREPGCPPTSTPAGRGHSSSQAAPGGIRALLGRGGHSSPDPAGLPTSSGLPSGFSQCAPQWSREPSTALPAAHGSGKGCGARGYTHMGRPAGAGLRGLTPHPRHVLLGLPGLPTGN